MTFLTPQERKFRLNRIRILFMWTLQTITRDAMFNVHILYGRQVGSEMVKRLFEASRPVWEWRRISDSTKALRVEGEGFHAEYDPDTGAGWFTMFVPVLGREHGGSITIVARDGFVWVEGDDEKPDFIMESQATDVAIIHNLDNLGVLTMKLEKHPSDEPKQYASRKILQVLIGMVGKTKVLEMLDEEHRKSADTLYDDWDSLHESIAETYFEPDAPRRTPQQQERWSALQRREDDDAEYSALLTRIANRLG